MPQSQNGSTINTNIAVNSLTGATQYTFLNPFNMLINLYNSADVVTIGGAHNDRFNLLNSTGLTINGSNGNNIFNVGAAAASLNGNVIRGGTGYDFVTLTGGNTTIDLTAGTNAGIEAVVGSSSFSGQTVVVKLSQLLGSALTNGGTGRAFVATIGSTGQVSVIETGSFNLVGIVDAAGNGFNAAGAAISGGALTSLKASVTQISQITGNLASIYANSATGAVPAGETQVSQNLSAYVFSDGAKSYTVWTDGVVTPADGTGTPMATAYQPLAAAPAAPFVYNSVAVFNKADTWAGAGVYTDANGLHHLRMIAGNAAASSAINLTQGVTDTNVHGDAGTVGVNYFGLGGSGGNNTLYGSKAGNTYDLVNSTALQDVIKGHSTGFDVIVAKAEGADVNLTVNGAAGRTSTFIDAVVGKATTTQTVELDVNSVRYAVDGTGAKSAVFTAFLGSDADTLDLSGSGKWVEVATFAPGSSAPLHAAALQGASVLNAHYGTGADAAAVLTGHLFEQVGATGNAIKYLTVYTDATIINELAEPSAFALSQMGLFI